MPLKPALWNMLSPGSIKSKLGGVASETCWDNICTILVGASFAYKPSCKYSSQLSIRGTGKWVSVEKTELFAYSHRSGNSVPPTRWHGVTAGHSRVDKNISPWHVLSTGLCWTEAKFIYSYFKDRLKIYFKGSNNISFSKEARHDTNYWSAQRLKPTMSLQAGQTFIIIKHTLLLSRSLNKTTQNQCTFSPFPLA